MQTVCLAIYQPVSWPVASGVCFFEMQSYYIYLPTLFRSNVVLWCLVGMWKLLSSPHTVFCESGFFIAMVDFVFMWTN